MPGPLERGAVYFEAVELIERQTGQQHEIFRIDCVPPPEGMVTTFSPPPEIVPVVEPGHLQQSELDRLLEGARAAGAPPLTADALMTDLLTDWRFNRVTVELNRIPERWRRRSVCYSTSVRYFAVYAVFEVVARTRQQITLGGELYKADDTVATFRIWKPLSCYFVRHFVWSPECCPGTPPRTRGDEHSKEHGPGAHARFEFDPFRIELRPLPMPWWPRLGGTYTMPKPSEEEEPSEDD
jgi:hypothetical protein